MNTEQTHHTLPIRFLLALATLVALIASVLIASPAQAATTTTSMIPRGSTWSYHYDSTAPASGWQTSADRWATGTAPLGRGTRAAAVTTLTTSATSAPLSAFFRKTFTLTDDLPEWAWLNTWADDGIVVWVNGTEVGRQNAPAGTISAGSYATAAPSSTSARGKPVTFTVPPSVLRPGANTIAVQVLSNWRRTPDISFDGHLVREDRPGAGTVVPTEPAKPAPPADPAPGKPAPPADGEIAGWGAPSWRDEFTYTDPGTGRPAVDPAKWNVRDRSDLGLLFDAAEVRREQVSVDTSGLLHIRADWLDKPVVRPSSQSGPRELWHKTGYLDQRKLRNGDVSRAQQYGRWEIRAKTPTGPHTFGSLAAFWLRNSQSGEIDIMEAWGYDAKAVRDQRIDTATTTVHTHTSNPGANSRYIWHHADFGAQTPVWNGFHTYAFEFTPTYAAVIVDGKQLLRATPATHPNLWNADYFGSPLHMRLNLHVGPSEKYWGLPDPANRAKTQNLDFQVDYVRTWEYKGK